MNYTDSKQFEDGKKTEASDTLYQNYYLRLDKSITPVLSYQLYLRSTLTNSHNTDSQGKTTNSYLRAIEPAMDIFLRNPAYGLEAGYRRLEQWSTANLIDEGRQTTDFYYSRFSLTPHELPSVSLQFDRQKDYDYLSESKLDRTNTRYSGSSWYDFPYKDLKLSYNLSYTRNEDETPLDIISKTINNNLNGSYNIGYKKSFLGGSANVSAYYQGNYVRNENELFVSQTGNVPFKRSPSLGMYGVGTQLQPEADTLASTITLSDNIYNVPATSTSGTINLGRNGKEFHNTGIQLFSSTKPVDTIFIYVNKNITTDTNLIQTANWKAYRSEYNLPATWIEIAIQSVTVSVFDALNNIYRYEIRFSAPQNNLYFRVINMDTASLSDVLVTEIEAYGTDVIPQSGKLTDKNTFFTQGISFNANVRPVSKVTFSLNYFLNRADQNPESVFQSVGGAFANLLTKTIEEQNKKMKSNVTRTFGAGSTWLTHRLLTTAVRFQRNEAFDNKKETDIRSDTYSLDFTSSPLPTLDSRLSFIRTYNYDFNQKQSVNDLYLLTIGSRLYRDVNMITDMGYTRSKRYEVDDLSSTSPVARDTSSSTRYIRGTIDATLTRKLSGNLTYGLSRTSGSTSSFANDAILIMTYRPGRFISLTGSLRIKDTDDETTTSEEVLVDWLVLPAIRLNLNYQHAYSDEGPKKRDFVSSYFIWYITRFLDFQFSYSYTREIHEKKTEIYALVGNLTCRFW